MPINTFIVDETFDQKRVDQVVATHYPDISRTKVLKIIKSDMLKINGKVMSNASTKVKVGDEIQFETLQAEELNLVPKKIDLNINNIKKNFYQIFKLIFHQEFLTII